MRVILFILKLIGRILLIPLWLILAFIGVCVSAVVNLYCVAKRPCGSASWSNACVHHYLVPHAVHELYPFRNR